MSWIHGLTSRGRILRRVDRFPRCLQEELSEINASVFSTSLIELSSIKPLKLNLSAPISPLSSRLVWHIYSKFKFLPIHTSPTCSCSPRLCTAQAAVYQQLVLLSSSRDGVDALQWCFTIIEIRLWKCCIRPYLALWKMKAWRNVGNNPVACLWPRHLFGQVAVWQPVTFPWWDPDQWLGLEWM